MNIFFLDYDVLKCAQYHCDRHLVKMITEHTQMLSTACRMNGIEIGYKITHSNHPCTRWVQESSTNWTWLRQLTLEMEKVWRKRFNHSPDKRHKSAIICQSLKCPKLPARGITTRPQCMPDQYKDQNPVTAYRNFYKGEKYSIATWKDGNIPYWW